MFDENYWIVLLAIKNYNVFNFITLTNIFVKFDIVKKVKMFEVKLLTIVTVNKKVQCT